ncbi:hypothetical protein ACWDSJ_13810 [Nocardia sp. NPDC003482]
MKRLSATAAVVAALALPLSACGGNDSSGHDGHDHQHGTTTAAAPTSAAPTTTFTVIEPPSEAPKDSAQGLGSQTTCAQFKTLDAESEKAVIDQVLADNPGSKLDGNPSLALGTAKLVCLASSQADKPVAVAIGVATR